MAATTAAIARHHRAWTPTTPSSSASVPTRRPGGDLSRPAEGRTRRSRSTGPPRSSTASGADFENLPRFMSHLESVQATGDRRSHWKAKAPAGMTVEWDAEITEDRPERADRLAVARRARRRQRRARSGSCRRRAAAAPRSASSCEYDPPGGVRRARGRQALRRGARAAGVRRPAPLQAGDGDRRGRPAPTASIDGARMVQRPAQPPASRWPRRSSPRARPHGGATACPLLSDDIERGGNDESELLGRAGQDPGASRSPTRRSSTSATRSSGSPRPRSAAPTCTSTTASSRRWRRATSSATSSWARSSRSASGVKNLKVGRPRRRPVPDRLRQLLRAARQSCTRSARTRTRTPGWPRS